MFSGHRKDAQRAAAGSSGQQRAAAGSSGQQRAAAGSGPDIPQTCLACFNAPSKTPAKPFSLPHTAQANIN